MGAQAHKATQSAKPAEIERQWWVIDAQDVALGRLCTRVASVLRGKHRPFFTPHTDCGDHVIVINAASVKLTGAWSEPSCSGKMSASTTRSVIALSTKK